MEISSVSLQSVSERGKMMRQTGIVILLVVLAGCIELVQDRARAFVGLAPNRAGEAVMAESTGTSAATAAEPIESYDAVELNRELIGNELKAKSFQGKTIEVSGSYYGTVVIEPGPGHPKEAYLVTFQGYAGLGECLHIKCYFFDKKDLVALNRGDRIRIQGKVAVKRDLLGIEAKLVN
jgi:hypothetical protein